MKKSLLLLLLLAIFSGFALACNSDEKELTLHQSNGLFQTKTFLPTVYIVDLPGIETGFFVDYNSVTKKFNKYYVFQYDAPSSLFDVSKVYDSELVETHSTYIKVLIDGTLYVFTTDTNYQAATGETVFNGYGLSERIATEIPFLYTDSGNDLEQLITDIQVDGSAVLSLSSACDSGGSGATSCSTSGPLNQGSCSVSCSSPYYACCVSSSLNCSCKLPGMGGGKAAKRVSAITRTPKG